MVTFFHAISAIASNFRETIVTSICKFSPKPLVAIRRNRYYLFFLSSRVNYIHIYINMSNIKEDFFQ